MATLSVVLDTNILLSGLAYPSSIPGKILAAWRSGAVDVVLSAYILEELRRVLPKLAHRHGLSASAIDDLIDTLELQVDMVEPDATLTPELRDAKDQPVLATLRASQAAYLITGDKGLLALASAYPIITPTQFWTAHGA